MNLVAMLMVSLFLMTLLGKRVSESVEGEVKNDRYFTLTDATRQLTRSKREDVEETLWR